MVYTYFNQTEGFNGKIINCFWYAHERNIMVYTYFNQTEGLNGRILVWMVYVY